MRKIVLFDVLNTLIHEPFAVELPAFFGLTSAELIQQKDPTAWTDFEAGRIDERTYLRTMFADRRVVDGAGLTAHLRRAYRWLDGMEEVVAELKARGVEMHVLSNFSQWYRTIEERTGLSRFMPWTFVSCRTGVRKPEAEAYLRASHVLGVAPGQCVFVDDRVINVEVAEAVGMTGIVRRDTRTLREAMVRHGLLGRAAGSEEGSCSPG